MKLFTMVLEPVSSEVRSGCPEDDEWITWDPEMDTISLERRFGVKTEEGKC